MRWAWISIALAVAVGTVGTGCEGYPKRLWTPPPAPVASAPPPKEEQPPPPPEEEKPKEPSQKEVCEKMWGMIESEAKEEAEKAAKAKGKKKEVKVPTEDDKAEFLTGCVENGKTEKKENPKRFQCMRKCILDNSTTKEVETCSKECQ